MTAQGAPHLPKRQRDLLEFLILYSRSYGIAPTYDEMKSALGLKSKGNVAVVVWALEHKGYICTLPRRARAITILRNTDGCTLDCGCSKCSTRRYAKDAKIFNAALTHDTPRKLSSFKMVGIRLMSPNQKRALLGLSPLERKEVFNNKTNF
jgi:SOS-response transcriptional repressor LexA